MTTNTEIPIAEIIVDIRSGAGDVLIMKKYQISPAVLFQIKEGMSQYLARLKEKEAAAQSDADNTNRRKAPRNHPYYRIPIRDLNDAKNVGTINDITVRGLQSQGMVAKTGEKLTLLVLADSFRVYSPLVFEATCRWTALNAQGDKIAGFSITNISGPDLQELRKLISELTAIERA
jgi:hypothetical protein